MKSNVAFAVNRSIAYGLVKLCGRARSKRLKKTYLQAQG